MKDRRVVVTGIGMVTPFGVGREVFWSNARAGRSATRRIQSFDPAPYRCQTAGECPDFDPTLIVEKGTVHRYDRFTLFALSAAAEAVADSRIEPPAERSGVVIGCGMAGVNTADRQHDVIHEKGRRWVNPLTVPLVMHNAAAAHIGMRFNLRGPSLTISTACASGAHAIGESYRMIEHGYADVMLAGGTEAALSPGAYTAWDALRVMALRNGDPAGASRPFAQDRTGFVMAEGAAIVVLEEYRHALNRGASIYAECLGYGATSDAYHVTRPSQEGETLAMRLALNDAGVSPAEVDYINAHGTATDANDRTETLAIKEVFGERASRIPVSSVKSMIGHSIGAAGAIEFSCICLTLRDDIVVPTINLDCPDPECDLDYVPHHARNLTVRIAVSNSFGFGGCNAILVAGKFNPE